MLKKAIREVYLKKRLLIDDDQMNENTSRILTNFSSLQLPEVKHLLSYYPISERKEFNVSEAAEMVRNRFPEVKISWPRIDATNKTMEAVQVRPDGLYSKNIYNILEPIHGDLVEPEEIDLVFVPLVTFDEKGFRIGYGKGFYDRYLVRCRPTILKIEFSFFDPVKSIRDINHFDVPLSLCITPSRIYEF